MASSVRDTTTNNEAAAASPNAAVPFSRRHIGPSPDDISAMLETVGAASLEALMEETVPASILDPASSIPASSPPRLP